MKTNAYNQRRAPTVWNSTTLQPPSSMRPQLHSAVHQNSGLSCFHILQFVAHIKAIFPSPVAITCGRGVSCAGQCSALGAQFCPTGVGTRGRSFMIKHVLFFGQVYAVDSLVTAGTTGRTRTGKRIQKHRKSRPGGRLDQPLFLPG